MLLDIGDTEGYNLLDAMEYLKVLKIQKENKDYIEQYIDLNMFNEEVLSYNESYDDLRKLIIERIFSKISENIEFVIDNDILKELLQKTTKINAAWTDEEIEELGCDFRILILPISKNACVEKIKSNLSLVTEGILEFDESSHLNYEEQELIMYKEGYMYLGIDKIYISVLLNNVDFVELLYRYKNEGILL